MALTKYKLGQLLELCDERNSEGKYSLDDVKGISIQKCFIETKANMENVSLSPYILVKPDYFAYVTVTSRNGEKITIAHNTSDRTYIVSSSYVVFKVKHTDLLLSDYLFMYFNRPEFDRYSRFNSWGSARETFDWDTMYDIDIELPNITVQQKYVDIYKAMVANQQSYERGLEDLKNAFDASIDRIKYTAPCRPVGELLCEVDNRNENGEITSVQGINITKQFMPSVANTNGIDLTKYKLVKKNQLAFSGMQTGRDKCIRIALNKDNNPIIISPAYTVLDIKDDKIIPEYIMIWFSREESDRRGWFMSDSSIRSNLDLDRFYEIQLPIPDDKTQRSIVNIFNVYLARRNINEQLKAQIKNICPILIWGSLEKGKVI